VEVSAKVTRQVPKGMVWMAFHFREGNANWLTNPVFDPFTLTAEYKACAVAIEKICRSVKTCTKKGPLVSGAPSAV
jgi:formate dehydrogenase major subunit